MKRILKKKNAGGAVVRLKLRAWDQEEIGGGVAGDDEADRLAVESRPCRRWRPAWTIAGHKKANYDSDTQYGPCRKPNAPYPRSYEAHAGNANPGIDYKGD